MINSLLKNKLSQKIKDQLICEDTKTSSFFEIFLLLPDKIIWDILRDSIIEKNDFIKIDAGELGDFSFWPSWKATEKTRNSCRVEPDLFLSFKNIDVIVEAKIDLSNIQNELQWRDEILSYKNKYGKDRKVCLLAVDGNINKNISEKEDVFIYKTTWSDIFNEIIRKENIIGKNNRIYNLLQKTCNILNITKIEWLTDEGYYIPYECIAEIEQHFTIG